MKKKKLKQGLVAKIVNAVCWGLVIVVIGALAMVMSAQDKDWGLLGWHQYTVLSSSMEPDIPRMSVVFVQETNPADIRIGDAMTFDTKDGRVNTHKVIAVLSNYQGSGQFGFRTKGVNNPSADPDVTMQSAVHGVVRAHVNELGYTYDFAQNNILLLFAILACFIAAFTFISRGLADKRKIQKINDARALVAAANAEAGIVTPPATPAPSAGSGDSGVPSVPVAVSSATPTAAESPAPAPAPNGGFNEVQMQQIAAMLAAAQNVAPAAPEPVSMASAAPVIPNSTLPLSESTSTPQSEILGQAQDDNGNADAVRDDNEGAQDDGVVAQATQPAQSYEDWKKSLDL
ncbi:hypothetical protein FACS1894125_3030 [Actinomycetota bacterium]|nr:hypothetical protein FACS1894125_3030 [Actinomycetota bacterium]